MNMRPVLTVVAAAALLAGCGRAPIATSSLVAQGAAMGASSIFHFLPKNRELTPAEQHQSLDGLLDAATKAAVAWNKNARLVTAGSNTLDATGTRTITGTYTYVFNVGWISKLYVSIEGNQMKFSRRRWLPLTLDPLLPFSRQNIATSGLCTASQALQTALPKLPKTSTYKLWLVMPKNYVDPIYDVTADQFLGLGKTVQINAASGGLLNGLALPAGLLDKVGQAVSSVDQAQPISPDAPADPEPTDFDS